MNTLSDKTSYASFLGSHLGRLKEVRPKGRSLRRYGARFAAFRVLLNRARSNEDAKIACQ